MRSSAWEAVLAFLVFGVALSNAIPVNNEASSAWESFVQTYGKTYPTEQEYQQRKAIFLENYQKIQDQNEKFHSSESTAEYGVNQFSDMSSEEFIKGYTGLVLPKEMLEKDANEQPIHVDAPSSYDSRDMKYLLTAVKDQGGCGACWAFNTQASVEVAYNKKQGKLAGNFSAQYLIDCSQSNYGCNGGWPDSALEYLNRMGTATEAAYPYTGVQGTCKWNLASRTYGGFTYKYLSDFNDTTLQNSVFTFGSMIVTIDANPLQSYKGGIIEAANCSEINHGVNVVGYVASGVSTPYYILRNSWSSKWGEDGYFRLAMTSPCFIRDHGWYVAY